MPNLLFMGFSEEGAVQIISCLNQIIPDIMEEAVYKAYPDDAPVYAKSGGLGAPYIILRTNDQKEADLVREAIQEKIDSIDGPPDIEVEIIQFYPSDGKVCEDNFR